MALIALRAARKAGALIVRATDDLQRLQIQRRGEANFVTEIDLASERELLNQLRKTYPDHAYICEEGGHTGPKDANHVWYIDPLDGTNNFIRGIPHFCISLACVKDGKLEHAVVFDPLRHEEFTASRGCGAQINGRRMRVSTQVELKNSIIGTGLPYLGPCENQLNCYSQTMAHVASRSLGIRRMGAAALDLAYVAAGRLDGFWERGLQPWNIAAGTLLIRESGGLVSNFEGSEDVLSTGDLVTANPKLLKKLISVLQ